LIAFFEVLRSSVENGSIDRECKLMVGLQKALHLGDLVVV